MAQSSLTISQATATLLSWLVGQCAAIDPHTKACSRISITNFVGYPVMLVL